MEDSHSELEDEKLCGKARKYDASESDTENDTDSELSKGRKRNEFEIVAAEPGEFGISS